MKVRMRTNLGTQHAKVLGVNAAECRSGMEPEIGEDAGLWLVKRRMADEVPVVHARPAPILAVPPEPVKAVPPSFDMGTQTAPDTKAKRKSKDDDAQ